MPKKPKHETEASLAADTVRRLQAPDTVQVVELDLDLLDDDPQNPNKMTDQQLDSLTAAIERVGLLQPALVLDTSDGRFRIIDGHHRVKAARRAGLKRAACVVVTTTDQAAAVLQIGMNNLRGELDLSAVARVFDNLQQDGFDINDMVLTGYSAEEINSLLDSLQESTEEDILAGGVGGDGDTEPTEDEAPLKPFVLELTFSTKDALNRAKRALKRAAGGDELGVGLLNLIDGEAE